MCFYVPHFLTFKPKVCKRPFQFFIQVIEMTSDVTLCHVLVMYCKVTQNISNKSAKILDDKKKIWKEFAWKCIEIIMRPCWKQLDASWVGKPKWQAAKTIASSSSPPLTVETTITTCQWDFLKQLENKTIKQKYFEQVWTKDALIRI